MSFDFYAEFYSQKNPNEWQTYAKIKLIEIGDAKRYPEQIRKHYVSSVIKPNFKFIKDLNINNITGNIPNYSYFLLTCFQLKKPYISAENEGIYPKDNPISKEKVFKIPYIQASSWKGNLRWMATKLLAGKVKEISLEEVLDERAKIVRLFGNEKDNVSRYLDMVFAQKFSITQKEIEDEFIDFLRRCNYIKKGIDARKGRLHIYPTFFDQIDLDVINPHDRKTRAGTVPISIEIVPENTNGRLDLFYYPFDRLEWLYSSESDEREKAIKEIKEDLNLLKDIIKPLLITYGFSAKKTSGYGVIKEDSFRYEIISRGLNVNPTEGTLANFQKLGLEGLE